MYQLQEKPDEIAVLSNGVTVVPLRTLKDEHGGILHIIEDDHCYVLIGIDIDKRRSSSKECVFTMMKHWCTEVVEAMVKTLPPNAVKSIRNEQRLI